MSIDELLALRLAHISDSIHVRMMGGDITFESKNGNLYVLYHNEIRD